MLERKIQDTFDDIIDINKPDSVSDLEWADEYTYIISNRENTTPSYINVIDNILSEKTVKERSFVLRNRFLLISYIQTEAMYIKQVFDEMCEYFNITAEERNSKINNVYTSFIRAFEQEIAEFDNIIS